MPTARAVWTIATGLEPLTKNNYRMLFSFDQDFRNYVVDNDVVAASYMAKLDGRHDPVEVAFEPPTFSGQQRTVRRNNLEVKYAGFPEFGDVSLSMNLYFHPGDYSSTGCERFFYAWWCMSYGISLKAIDSNIFALDSKIVNRLSPARDFSGYYEDKKVGYKQDATVVQFARDDTPLNRWKLDDIYPKRVKFDPLDNSNDGDIRQMHVEFSVDSCTLLY